MPETAAADTSLDAYLVELDRFVGRCVQLVDAGLPYFAVVLCHELFRFLYPVEPYADFAHAEPMRFALGHVRKLLALADAYEDAVAPYAPLDGPGGAGAAANLEIRTSDLYSALWLDFDEEALARESKELVERRLPADVVSQHVVGKRVVDVGCGSGRYTIALAQLGAAEAVGVDYQGKAFAAAAEWAGTHDVPARFMEGDVLALPFPDAAFDFVFSNGVIHHSASIEQGLREIARVMRPEGAGFLYLYAAGGVFWETRRALREVFARIPLEYTREVLRLIGMPSNRFIFCDTWYVPVETHTPTKELHELFDRVGLDYEKVPGANAFDLDRALELGLPAADDMWGDGEHRYVLRRKAGA